MKIKVKSSIITFYDMVTKAMFTKEYLGRFTHKTALAKLNPTNKTKVVDIVNTSNTYDIDDNLIIEFIANNGEEVVNNDTFEKS